MYRVIKALKRIWPNVPEYILEKAFSMVSPSEQLKILQNLGNIEKATDLEIKEFLLTHPKLNILWP